MYSPNVINQYDQNLHYKYILPYLNYLFKIFNEKIIEDC